MEEEQKKTVGAIAREFLQKEPDSTDPIELEREIHKDTYEDNVYLAIELSKKKLKSPFYVVVLTKKERLMENVLRHYFFARQSCPTPTWDQTVYRYKAEGEQVEFLWTVPDKQTCELLLHNKLQVPPNEMWLLNLIMSFYDGSLDKQARLWNKETFETIVPV